MNLENHFSATSERRKPVIDSSERKCSITCNHKPPSVKPTKLDFRTQKQLKEEEDRINILKTKILCKLNYISSYLFHIE